MLVRRLGGWVTPLLALGLAACGAAHGTAQQAAPAGSAKPETERPAGHASSAAGRRLPPIRHVVVVVEENHAYHQVIGSRDAPYINRLARIGASFTNAHGITHPSQPNYLALFSGSVQGVTNDSCPHVFRTASLGGQLLGRHRRFVGYSESLPRTGYRGCATNSYARKHNPWVDFSRIPSRLNKPFGHFPRRFWTLPAVTFVIPNQQHDMHSGSVAAADGWLRQHLGRYARWARSHHSLLILTWDEDDFTSANHIATIIVGAHVRPGRYARFVNHYSLLRTIEDLYRLRHVGRANSAVTIRNIWR